MCLTDDDEVLLDAPLTRERRCDRLDDLTRRGLIIRDKWTDGERACLLAALSPEVAEEEHENACPTDVIPLWFAKLTPRIDDRTSLDYWPEMVREYGRVVRRADVLTLEDWRQMDFALRALALRVALPHALEEAQPVIERVIVMCERQAAGELVPIAEWESADNDRDDVYFDAEEEGDVDHVSAVRQAVGSALLHRGGDPIDVVEAAASAAAPDAVATDPDEVRDAAPSAAVFAAWDAMAKGILAAIDARCAIRETSC